LRLGLIGANGKEIALDLENGEELSPGVLAVTKLNETFRFRNVPSAPVPSLLRGFSAPVNIAIDLPDSDLSFLITHDSDLFNRWQAANRYATRAILALVTGETAPPATAGKFADAIAGALADPALDAAYKAELLKLPTQSDIAREKGRNVDPAAIDQAHRRFAAEAGAALGNLSAFYFYSYVAIQIPTGLIADRWGPRKLLTASIAQCRPDAARQPRRSRRHRAA